MTSPQQFRLVTLGRLALFDAAGSEHELTKQRRKLALLAYLAMATRAVPRETLTAVFWPDEEDARARHSLSNALSSLRAVLGRSAIELGRVDVALAAEAPLEIDVRSVARAAAAGDWSVVLRRATGVFLDGLFVPGSQAFETWVSAERRRFTRMEEDACRAVSPQLLADGQWSEAITIGDRWLAIAPLSAEAALARLQAELGDGDIEAVRRTQVLHERLARRAKDEFNEGLDPRVGAWVVRLVPRPAADLVVPPQPVAVSHAERAPSTATPQGTMAPDAVQPAVTSPFAAVDPSPPRRRRLALAVGAAVIGLVGIAAATLRRPSVTATPWVVIADIENTARDSALDRAVPFALGLSLAQSGRTEVVPRSRLLEVLQQMRRPDSLPTVDEATALDAAARIGADAVLVPTLARAGGSVLLGTRLIDARSGRLLRTEQVQLRGDSALLSSIDELARRTRRTLGEGALDVRRGTALPEATTASVAALRAYAEGLRASERERMDDAQFAFRSALLHDSTFARAHAALGFAYAAAGMQDSAERSFARALSFIGTLPAREVLTIRNAVAVSRRDWSTVLDLQRSWLASHPRDRESLRQYAYALFRSGNDRAAAAAFRSLLTVDSLDADTWANYASSVPDVTPVDLEEKLAAWSHLFRLAPDRLTSFILNQGYGGTLARAGMEDSARAVFRLMLPIDAGHRARGLRSLGHLGLWRGDYAAALDAFREAALLEAQSGQAVGRLRAQLGEVAALQGVGRAEEARAVLTAARRVFDVNGVDLVLHGWTGKALARAGDLAGALEVRRTMQRRAVPDRPGDRKAMLLLDGELASARGEHQTAVRLLDSLWRIDSSSIVLESRAHAIAPVAPERAVQLYDRLGGMRSFGWEGTEGERLAQLHAAKLRLTLGDSAGARHDYAAFVRRYPAASPNWLALLEARRGLSSLGQDISPPRR